MNTGWPMVRLGELLQPVSRAESVDPMKQYRLLGIRLDGRGPFLREVVTGGQTAATKLFRVAKGDFIYSRLFACRGAFGIVNDELDSCFVSGEFPTFLPILNRLDLNFLRYWFRLPTTLTKVDKDCTGSTPLTRNRFKEQFFLALEITLPSRTEQQRIVARIEKLAAQISEAHHLRQQAIEEAEALVAAKMRDIIQENNSKVRHLPFTEIARLERRPISVQLNQNYQEIGVYSFGRGIFHKTPRTGAEVGNKDLYEIRTGDFILQVTFAWEGAVALADQEDDGLFGSVRYLTFRINEEVCNPWYLLTYMKTPEAISQLGTISPGSAGRNRVLSVKRLGEVMVPVVPLDYQVWMTDALKAELNALKTLQAKTASELDALMPSILDHAFKGELC